MVYKRTKEKKQFNMHSGDIYSIHELDLQYYDYENNFYKWRFGELCIFNNYKLSNDSLCLE